MLSRFHRIPERDGQNLRAIKTVENNNYREKEKMLKIK